MFPVEPLGMFPEPICFPVPMLPGTYCMHVPRFLCSRAHMLSGIPVFSGSYIPLHVPMFRGTYDLLY